MKRAKASQGSGPVLILNPKLKLLGQMREVLRFHHYSIRTEKAYCQWVRRFILFHRGTTGPSAPAGSSDPSGWRHPREMGAPEVVQFLTHLAAERDVTASTQNQALNALIFLYAHVLQMPLGELGKFARAVRPARLPQVLTQEETRRVLRALKPGTTGLILRLLYGTGMRLIECLRLRVKDIEFSSGRIMVREGKGDKDRLTMLPRGADCPTQPATPRNGGRGRSCACIKRHLAAGNLPRKVYLPHALARRNDPQADRQ